MFGMETHFRLQFREHVIRNRSDRVNLDVFAMCDRRRNTVSVQLVQSGLNQTFYPDILRQSSCRFHMTCLWTHRSA